MPRPDITEIAKIAVVKRHKVLLAAHKQAFYRERLNQLEQRIIDMEDRGQMDRAARAKKQWFLDYALLQRVS